MSVTITVSPAQPFTVSVFAYEEDTSLILSTAARVQSLQDHPLRVMTALVDAPTYPPGTVLPRGGSPLRLFAVVHDLEQEPSTRDEWILRALENVLSFCRTNHVIALGLDPLGAVHGQRSADQFRQTLQRQLSTSPLPALHNIWLRSSGTGARIL
jgi:hypothetical protein